MPLLRFAPKTWVLWHDNLGTAAQKVGWIVAGFQAGKPIEVEQRDLACFDLKFLMPRWNEIDAQNDVYLCALPNPNGQPYLIRPQSNRIVPMPASKTHNVGLETLNDDMIGQSIHVRSEGGDPLVHISGTTIGRLQSVEVKFDEKGNRLITLVGYMPDLSIVGKIISIDTFDPVTPPPT